MNPTTFESITSYIKDVCGISLGVEKKYLLDQRLSPLLPTLGLVNLDELGEKMRNKFDSHLREQVIVAITTNETSFFRDTHPYQLFKEVIIPELINRVIDRKSRNFQRRGPKVSIWSSACSTGQEPYSMAMKIIDSLALRSPDEISCEDFRILATDISSKVLSKAILGSYSKLDISRGMSPLDVKRFFENEDNVFTAKDDLKQLIEFQSMNLTKPFSHIGSFDVIFCRNVLIYFEDDTKEKIINQMIDMLTVGGFLVLGSTERMYTTVHNMEQKMYNGSSYYIKK